MSIAVTGLATTPVKGTRLNQVKSISLDRDGARGNRSFYVIDEHGRMVNGKVHGALQTVVSDYDGDGGELTLTFASGASVTAPVQYGNTVATRFFSSERDGRELLGPFSAALSEQLGLPLRLIGTEAGVDRGRDGGASIISRGSLEKLAKVLGSEPIDARRFRMLVEIDGVGAHEEDGWVGRRVRIGNALVAMHGHVGRCMITTRHPETGAVDLRTLHALASYRSDHDSTEPLPFGVYGEVLEGGTVSIGDPVSLDGRA